MTRSVFALFAILALCSLTMAQENPDSRVSLTVGVDGAFGSGEHLSEGYSQDADNNNISFGALLKYPASRNLTLRFKLSHYKATSEWKENLWYYGSENDVSMVNVGFAITFYFGSSINNR